MWSVLRIFLSERGEADFASDCTTLGAVPATIPYAHFSNAIMALARNNLGNYKREGDPKLAIA